MQVSLNPEWLARNNDEHKIRRNDHRSPFQRDRARILHSAAFRRLQAKTQVHGTSLNDFYRTRLTHSLEAAQIGTGIVAQIKLKQPEFRELLPSDSLIDSLCLAHDIGHPPYGHGGEIALNYMMRDHGGFEGNAQTFRIVTSLEPYTEHHGMNLSRRTLLGLLKYPALLSATRAATPPPAVAHQRQLKAKDWSPAKGIYDCDLASLDWVLEPLCESDRELLGQMRAEPSSPKEHRKTRFKSLDCSIMELADDIAYGVHDLEDAIVLGMVTRAQWQEAAAAQLAECGDPWFEEHIAELSEMLFSGKHYVRKDAIGGIVNALLTSISVKPVEAPFHNELLAFNAYIEPHMGNALEVLKHFVSQYVIQIPQVQRFEYKGQQLIMDLFEALSADPERLLPQATGEKWRKAQEQEEGMRVICDYIAAMTDAYAQRLHQQLFSAQSHY
ncbi:TPA: anti-phage deoxyguanosine triphosphatase [Vibrio cholerae]|uniref:anti-phage deoxyguanosine triphosphatase n=1 Tax=Vibrio cholerae TaxID=666 RepID=UPI0018F05BA6|nr:anti-phage deoxyguanosine triphosphatase [Vibrio cholerae]MBJ6885742.1 deoxyguanosinetriphosphate triphosphohydrolase family protein [Vibrio cholerae]UIP04884.1 deoxyguanosinetriphosphate triphosphohydrolase family protein [Vibrio cholerae]HEQ3432897.1 deoxyguanosinetriphosphate triphosphohydrolase family protein [Vibrio cholerae]HEQ3493776.1 deoxyguanosinetriphosphate triphosphohydrolase family protein [Vibrio cholerae]HEQ3505532.1 deoxyguanosinetriphosphate triphosphohydrolase family prot